MPYIDRDALMRELGINDMDCGKCGWGQYGYCKRGADFTDACFAIENAPTIDAVEVVRCKDCKHYRDSFPYNTCDVFDAKATDAEDYCSYGERKETEDDT